MANKGKKVVVEAVLTGDGKQLTGVVKQAKEQLKDLGNEGKKSGKDASSWMEQMGRHMKELRKERRTSGESAMAGAMGKGVGGMADYLMDAAGMGIQGIMVEGIGRTFANTAGMAEKMAAGGEDRNKALKEWAEGLFLVGDFVKGWDSVFRIVSGVAKEEEEMNQMLKEQERTVREIGVLHKQQSTLKKLGTENQQEKSAIDVMDEYQAEAKRIQDEKRKLTFNDEAYNKEATFMETLMTKSIIGRPAAALAAGEGFGGGGKLIKNVDSSIEQRWNEKHKGDTGLLDIQEQNNAKIRDKMLQQIRIDASKKTSETMSQLEVQRQEKALSLEEATAKSSEEIWAAKSKHMDFTLDKERGELELNATRAANAGNKGLAGVYLKRYNEMPAEAQRDKEQAWKKFTEERDKSRFGTTTGLYGSAGSMLSALQQQADTPELQRAQKILGAMTTQRGLEKELTDVLDNGNATPEQRGAARMLRLDSKDLFKMTTSEDWLKDQKWTPLRFAGANELKGSQSGAAGLALEKDHNQEATRQFELQQQANTLLTKISADIARMAGTDAAESMSITSGG